MNIEISTDEYKEYIQLKTQKEAQESAIDTLYSSQKYKGIKYDIKTKTFSVRLTHRGTTYPIMNYTRKFDCHSIKDVENTLEKFKDELDRGENPFENRAFGHYIEEYFNELTNPYTQLTYRGIYKHYAKDILHTKTLKQLCKEDIKKIYKKIQSNKKVLSRNTFVKMRGILMPTYRKLVADEKIGKNFLELVEIPSIKSHKKYPSLSIRLEEQDFKNVGQKLYRGILKIENIEVRNYLLLTLMTGRRRSEVFRTSKENIKNGMVVLDNSKTKTAIYDRYLLPPEILEYIDSTDKEYPFKVDERAFGTAWKEILKKEEIAYTHSFRVYDCRHLFFSTMYPLYSNSDKILSACISHSKGDSDDNYLSISLEKRSEVFQEYWEILRGNK